MENRKSIYETQSQQYYGNTSRNSNPTRNPNPARNSNPARNPNKKLTMAEKQKYIEDFERREKIRKYLKQKAMEEYVKKEGQKRKLQRQQKIASFKTQLKYKLDKAKQPLIILLALGAIATTIGVHTHNQIEQNNRVDAIMSNFEPTIVEICENPQTTFANNIPLEALEEYLTDTFREDIIDNNLIEYFENKEYSENESLERELEILTCIGEGNREQFNNKQILDKLIEMEPYCGDVSFNSDGTPKQQTSYFAKLAKVCTTEKTQSYIMELFDYTVVGSSILNSPDAVAHNIKEFDDINTFNYNYHQADLNFKNNNKIIESNEINTFVQQNQYTKQNDYLEYIKNGKHLQNIRNPKKLEKIIDSVLHPKNPLDYLDKESEKRELLSYINNCNNYYQKIFDRAENKENPNFFAQETATLSYLNDVYAHYEDVITRDSYSSLYDNYKDIIKAQKTITKEEEKITQTTSERNKKNAQEDIREALEDIQEEIEEIEEKHTRYSDMDR